MSCNKSEQLNQNQEWKSLSAFDFVVCQKLPYTPVESACLSLLGCGIKMHLIEQIWVELIFAGFKLEIEVLPQKYRIKRIVLRAENHFIGKLYQV